MGAHHCGSENWRFHLQSFIILLQALHSLVKSSHVVCYSTSIVNIDGMEVKPNRHQHELYQGM